jgi:hypothetical protein
MSTFNTTDNNALEIDSDTGKKVKNIMEKYLTEVFSEELCDNIIADIKQVFGQEHPAQVNLDDETKEIEITVRDRNNKWIKCSSLTLFKDAQ